MTDAELATLKPGDRVRMTRDAPDGEWAGVVRRVDRRLVHTLRDDGVNDCADGRFLMLLPAPPDSARPDDDVFPSLELRWRALTDEVLVALRRLVGDGMTLDDLMICVAADEDRASAEIHRLIAEPGETPRAVRVATCAVGVDLAGEQSV